MPRANDKMHLHLQLLTPLALWSLQDLNRFWDNHRTLLPSWTCWTNGQKDLKALSPHHWEGKSTLFKRTSKLSFRRLTLTLRKSLCSTLDWMMLGRGCNKSKEATETPTEVKWSMSKHCKMTCKCWQTKWKTSLPPTVGAPPPPSWTWSTRQWSGTSFAIGQPKPQHQQP